MIIRFRGAMVILVDGRDEERLEGRNDLIRCYKSKFSSLVKRDFEWQMR